MKRGYLKMSLLTNYAKMQILKTGAPPFKLASCMNCGTFFVNIFTAKGTENAWLFRVAKSVVVSFYVVKKIDKMQVAG